MNRVDFYKKKYNYGQYLENMEIILGNDTMSDVKRFLIVILEWDENITDNEKLELIQIINHL